MNDSLIIYLNELKNKIVPKYKIIGITTQLIFSTSMYKRNSDIEPFLSEIFNLSFRPYVIKSRTLIASRVSRVISESDSSDIELVKRNLYSYLDKKLTKDKKIE